VVVLGFEYDLHRSRADEEQNKHEVEEVLGELFGRPSQVRCVLSKQRSSGQQFTPPAARPAGDMTVTPLDDDGIDDDPVVRAAIDLGAQVIRRPE
jgi:hypothetical protein